MARTLILSARTLVFVGALVLGSTSNAVLAQPGPVGVYVGGYYDVVPYIGFPSDQVFANGYTSDAIAEFGDQKAHLTIILPAPNADVMINGQKTASTGTPRYFVSPDLASGNYSYQVKATWQSGGTTVTKEYSVKVKPGAQSLVDFTRTGQ